MALAGQDLGTFLERSGLGRPRPCLVGASLGGLSILMSDAARGVASAIVLVDITPRMELAGVHRIVSFMQRTAASGFATLQEASAAVARCVFQVAACFRRPCDNAHGAVRGGNSYQQHRNREPRTQEQLQSLRKVLRQQEDGRWRWHWDPAFISGPKVWHAQRVLPCPQAVPFPSPMHARVSGKDGSGGCRGRC